MTIYLYLQFLCYDRPRLMHAILNKVSSTADIKDIINQLSPNDPFKKEAGYRLSLIDQCVSAMNKHNIHTVDIKNSLYPASLHQLSDPPLTLFYKGNLNICNQASLGIVGTRRPSVMANYRLETLFSALPVMPIVSGGALGIDAMVHTLALNQDTPTVSILASGLNVMTPSSNKWLFDRIIDSGIGCILSECPPGVSPKPYFFPQRNRLIAAMSHKLIVVEASKKSGAVLTANLAAQLAVDVGAVVGAFNSPQSEGCYDLMNDGATVIGNIKTLLDFLDIKSTQLSIPEPHECSSFLDMIPAEPIHIEDLAHQLRLNVNEIIEKISVLSLNGDVIISSGQMVSRYE